MPKTCKDCGYWDTTWFRSPKNDPKGKGLKLCTHPGFKGIMKWACLLTAPDSVPDRSGECIGFED